MRIARPTIGLALLQVVLVGCSAAIYSTPYSASTKQADAGLLYFLPSRDVIVTVVIGDSAPVVTVAAGPPYPDAGSAYILHYHPSLIGKNKMAVTAAESGLLTTANSTTTSGITVALKQLASTVGLTASMVKSQPQPQPLCTDEGTHVQTIGLRAALEDKVRGPCNTLVSVKPLPGRNHNILAKSTAASGKRTAGIFYRPNLPYRVDVRWKRAREQGESTGESDEIRRAVVLSPSLSRVFVLPIEKTLFAGNTASLGFVNGMPTKYEQEVTGELTGLLGLPAEVIGAYFGAVGQVIARDKDLLTAQSEAAKADIALQYADFRREACSEALAAQDETAIEEWCK